MRCPLHKLVFFLLPPLVLISCGGLSNSPNLTTETQPVQQSSTDSGKVFNYQNYASILKEYVNKQGLVDYKKLKENRQILNEFN